MFKEFKQFVMRGNVLDLAIGVIMGAAFGSVVNSMVNDIIMPPIGRIMANVDFKDLFFCLNGSYYPTLAAAKAASAPTVNYGVFLNTVLNFLIVAFVVFILVKQVDRLVKRTDSAYVAASIKGCPYCLSSIPMKAVKCSFCTSDLRESLPEGSLSSAAAASPMQNPA